MGREPIPLAVPGSRAADGEGTAPNNRGLQGARMGLPHTFRTCHSNTEISVRCCALRACAFVADIFEEKLYVDTRFVQAHMKAKSVCVQCLLVQRMRCACVCTMFDRTCPCKSRVSQAGAEFVMWHSLLTASTIRRNTNPPFDPPRAWPNFKSVPTPIQSITTEARGTPALFHPIATPSSIAPLSSSTT